MSISDQLIQDAVYSLSCIGNMYETQLDKIYTLLHPHHTIIKESDEQHSRTPYYIMPLVILHCYPTLVQHNQKDQRLRWYGALCLYCSWPPFSERGKAEPSSHEFKSPTTATHSTQPVYPSNPLPWRIADTKQMCCVLSCHDTELPKETL